MLRGAQPMAIVWGPEYRFLYNDRYAELLQDKHSPELGRRGQAMFPEVWATLEGLFRRAYQGEAITIDDISLPIKRQGKIRDAFFSGCYTPVADREGKIDGFLAVVVETTPRVQREQHSQILSTATEYSQDFPYAFDRQGRFVYASKTLLDVLGLSWEEAAGKTVFELPYGPELANRLYRQIQEVFSAKAVIRDECLFAGTSDRTSQYEYIFSPVLGEDGNVTMVAGTARDVTQQRRLEQALQDAQKRLESALSAGAIGTWNWNLLRNRLTADRVLAQFFFLSEAEAKDAPPEAYLRAIHPDDRPEVERAIQEAIQSTSRYSIDYRVVGTDRSVRWVAARGLVERDAAGRPVEMSGMVLDITERKMLEQQVAQTVRELRESQVELEHQAISLEETVRARTASLEDTVSELESFSYSISHDLRGPLRSLQSFAEALSEDFGEEVPPAGQDYLRRIVAAASRMDRIIQDVLVYSRVARSDLTFERIELNEFIAGLIESYPNFAPSQADIVIAGKLPAVAANPAVLTQCVANLLSNAVKFVAPGVRPRVQISAEAKDGRVYVSLHDNGIGIPEGSQQRVFELFHRLEPSYEGTGIGLAIVRRAIGRMGGRITLKSAPGLGSTFTFDLPAGD
jgi:PAS domain S-box-containing protein